MQALTDVDQTPIVVTCRIEDYEDITRQSGEKITLNGAVTLKPLIDSEIAASLGDQPDLLETLSADDSLREVARRPLILTLLAIAYGKMGDRVHELRNLGKSPANLRERIFENYIRNRFEYEQQHAGTPLPYTLEQLYEILGVAASTLLDYREWLQGGETREQRVVGGELANVWVSKTTARGISLNDAPRARNLVDIEPAVFQRILGDVKGTAFIEFARGLNILTPAPHGAVRFAHSLIRDHFALPICLKFLGHVNAEARSIAAGALGFLRDVRALEPLVTALNDNSYIVQGIAAWALGELGDSRAGEPLLANLRTDNWPNWVVIFLTVEALEKLGNNLSVEPLIAVLSCKDTRSSGPTALGMVCYSQAQFKVVQILSKIGKPSVEPLIAILNDASDEVRGRVAETLGMIGDPRAVEALITILNHRGNKGRERAAEALGRIGDPRAVEPLILALHFTHLPRWFHRLLSFLEYKLPGMVGDVIDEIINNVRLFLDSERVREQAAKALGLIGDARSRTALAAVLEDDCNVAVMRAAREALDKLAELRAA